MSAMRRRYARNKLALVGAATIALLVAVAVFAPFIAPNDPLSVNLTRRYLPGFWSADGLAGFPLGTDALGRCILSRVIYGARLSLWAGIISVTIALFLGTAIGVVAAYAGGKVDQFLMRAMEIILAFPSLVLALTIVAVLGPNLYNAMIAVGIVNIPGVSRLVRGATLKIKEEEYVTASISLGARAPRIMRTSVLPGLASISAVYGSALIGRAILVTASLSFLGLGAIPPTPEWGAMLVDARDVLLFGKWWVATFPGLAIAVSVLGFNLLGDGVGEAIDPRLRGRES